MEDYKTVPGWDNPYIQNYVVQPLQGALAVQDVELAYELPDAYFHIQTCDDGFDYTLYNKDFTERDGGVLETDGDKSVQEAMTELLAEFGCDATEGKVMDVGNSIIKDNIFAVIQNYARKKEIALEMLRYPIHDDELWALTFLKQDTIFVCVNTALPLCKQFFAAAHELYHIYCYVENADQSYIKNGSMLDSATGDETGRTQEDLEANAFAGLLLMPDQLLHEQILLYGLDKDLVTVDSVLMLIGRRFGKQV